MLTLLLRRIPLMSPPPPSTTLFPYTTLFRSAQRASPPNADSEVREAADAVDANGIEEVLLPFRDLHFRLQSAPNDLIGRRDRKSTRLNSSHVKISYAVFCLKKKTK